MSTKQALVEVRYRVLWGMSTRFLKQSLAEVCYHIKRGGGKKEPSFTAIVIEPPLSQTKAPDR